MTTLNTRTLLQKIKITDSPKTLINEILTLAQANEKFTSLGFMNQHGFNLMTKDASILDYFKALDFMVRDGIGMKIAFKLFRLNPGANLNGTDFIPLLVKATFALNADYYVFGTQSPWLKEGANNLVEGRAHQTLNGFKELADYIDYLNTHLNPEQFNVIVLAMGMPKQEALAELIKQTIKSPGLVICGGAIIDFQAGRFERAPEWMRTWSLEWFYRLLREPKRLFARYVIGIPIFFKNLYKYQ